MKFRIVEIEASGEEIHAALDQFRHLLTPASRAPYSQATPAETGPPALPLPPKAPAKKAPLPPPAPPEAINWDVYPINTAQKDVQPCVVCKQLIKSGDRYRNGNTPGRRAHVLCVASTA